MSLLERLTPFLMINMGILSVTVFSVINYRSRTETRSAKRIHLFMMLWAVSLGAISMEVMALSLLFRDG